VNDALIAHLRAHSVRTGTFTLKSGKTSSWFIDSKQTVCRPDGLLLVPTRFWPHFRTTSTQSVV